MTGLFLAFPFRGRWREAPEEVILLFLVPFPRQIPVYQYD